MKRSTIVAVLGVLAVGAAVLYDCRTVATDPVANRPIHTRTATLAQMTSDAHRWEQARLNAMLRHAEAAERRLVRDQARKPRVLVADLATETRNEQR